jgi:cytidyltransferase-like protein
MKNIGVILARLQPIHNGHLALIKKASEENHEVHVFIGSADKFNERNPIPISMRKKFAEDAIAEQEIKNVTLHLLDDLSDESDNSHDWGFYLYSRIVTEIQQSNFTIYYSDGYEIITSWFPSFILRNNVSLNLLARNATVSGISATDIRNLIMQCSDDLNDSIVAYDMLKEFVPTVVLENRYAIKNLIELSKLNK